MNEYFGKIKKHKSLILIVIGLLSAIILLAVSGSEAETVDMTDEVEEYSAQTEKRLTELLSAIDGIGSVRVMVSMESGSESVYAYDVESSENSEKYSYFTDSDKKPILLKEVEPSVRGVAVICDSGDNALIQSKVIALVSSVLGIPTNRIFVGS